MRLGDDVGVKTAAGGGIAHYPSVSEDPEYHVRQIDSPVVVLSTKLGE